MIAGLGVSRQAANCIASFNDLIVASRERINKTLRLYRSVERA